MKALVLRMQSFVVRQYERLAQYKEQALYWFFDLPVISRIFRIITPNQLCYFRMFAAPFVMLLFLQQHFTSSFILFCIAALTDLIDGPLARWKNQVSEEGKNLDPMADKMLITIPLILAGYKHFDNQVMTLYLTTAVLLIFTANVLKPYLRNRFSIPLSSGANGFGQVKMWLETITLGILLFDPLNPNILTLTENLLWVCIVFGVLSFLRHLARMDYPIEDRSKRIITLPNLITLAALFACIPAGFALVRGQFALAFFLLITIFLTDALDGWIAKRFDQATYFGAALDPVRDYTVRFLSLFWFIFQAKDTVTLLLGLFTAGIEIATALVNINTAKKCRTVALVNRWGKNRALIHFSLFSILLLGFTGTFPISIIWYRVCFSIILIVSILSLLSYVDQRRQLIISLNRTTGQD